MECKNRKRKTRHEKFLNCMAVLATRKQCVAGYGGVERCKEYKDRDLSWHIAARTGRRLRMGPESQEAWALNVRVSLREKVGHPYRYIKRGFGHDKVHYYAFPRHRN